MKIDKFEPKDLKRIVKKIEIDLVALKKKEPLLHKLKRWLLGA